MAIGPKITATIKRSTDTSDGMGGSTVSWADLKVVKGTLIALNAKERFFNDSTRIISTHFFQCNFLSDVTITEKDRFYYDGENYQIVFVDNLAKRGITLIFWLKKVS